MPPIAAISRRALVAAAAVAALAPGAKARKRKRKPQPQPEPLAFVAMVVTDVELRTQGEEPGFTWKLAGSLQHPETGANGPFPGEIDVPTAFTAQQTRDQIIREAREGASFVLGLQGILVSPDRVQVVLL